MCHLTPVFGSTVVDFIVAAVLVALPYTIAYLSVRFTAWRRKPLEQNEYKLVEIAEAPRYSFPSTSAQHRKSQVTTYLEAPAPKKEYVFRKDRPWWDIRPLLKDNSDWWNKCE